MLRRIGSGVVLALLGGATATWSLTLRLPTRSLTVADTVFESTPYIGVEAIDSLAGSAGQWVPDRQKWVVKENADSAARKRTWVFTLDNAFCSVGDRVFNLTYPVRRSADRLYVPLYPLLRLIQSETRWSVSIDPQDRAVLKAAAVSRPAGADPASAATGPVLLGPVHCESRANGTLVELGLSQVAQPEILFVPPNYLARFPKARLQPGQAKRVEGAGAVQSVLLTADSGQVQMTLQLRGDIDTVEIEANESAPGLRFVVRKAAAKQAREAKEIREAKEAVARKTGKGTIIVDPGHGGHDQGAQVGGVHEAQITLAVAKLLQTELQSLGYKALLTREEDKYITLADRPKFASEKGGDLFISLHCNSIDGSPKRKQQISGYTAYILREGASEEDNALARRENQVIQEEKGKASKAEISPVDWILLEHQLNLYSKQSEGFTEKLIASFEGFDIPKYGTGASQAGFFVLVGAYMPAVLFEMGFLTHEGDRQLMASKKGQKRIAKRLAEAIDRFMNYRKEG